MFGTYNDTLALVLDILHNRSNLTKNREFCSLLCWSRPVLTNGKRHKTLIFKLTCPLSRLVKVFHQSGKQNTKAKHRAKIDSIANRRWNTYDPGPRTILGTCTAKKPRYFAKALDVFSVFNHFRYERLHWSTGLKGYKRKEAFVMQFSFTRLFSITCRMPSV